MSAVALSKGGVRGEDLIGRAGIRRGFGTVIALVAVATATVGVLSACSMGELPPYRLDTYMPALPELTHKVDLGRAIVELEATATPLEISQRPDGEYALLPARLGLGKRTLYVSAYCTNKSWDYPALGFGDDVPTLTTAGGQTIAPGDHGGESRWATYSGRPTRLPLWQRGSRPRSIVDAQVIWTAAYDVPKSVHDFVLTWNLGSGGNARFKFRF